MNLVHKQLRATSFMVTKEKNGFWPLIQPLNDPLEKVPHAIAVGIILALGGFLRLFLLGQEGFSYDEIIMLTLTSGTWEDLIYSITNGRPPLLPLIGYGWVRLVGTGEYMVRLLPALVSIITLGLIGRIGRQFYGRTTGLVAGFLSAFSVFHLLHSQNYRYYGLFGLLATITVWLYLRAVENGSTSRFFQFSVAAILTFYTHTHGIFLIVGLGFHFLIHSKRFWAFRFSWIQSQIFILLGLGFGLWQIFSDLFGPPTTDGGALGPSHHLVEAPSLIWPFFTMLVSYSFHGLAINQLFIYSALGVLLFLICCLLFKPFTEKNRDAISIGIEKGDPKITLLWIWLLFPLALPLILSYIGIPMYLPRYTIPALPAFYLLLGWYISKVGTKIPPISFLVAFIVVTIPAIQRYYQEPIQDQFRELSSFVSTQAAATDGFFFLSINNEYASPLLDAFSYYYSAEIDVCGDLWVQGLTDLEIQKQINACSQDYERIWVVTRIPEAVHEVQFFELSNDFEQAKSYTVPLVTTFEDVGTFLIVPE